MDFLRRNFEVAQKQAQEAAARAKVLAKDVSAKTQVLAQQAGENAKVLAEQVSVKTRELAEEARTRAKNFSADDARQTLKKLGITDDGLPKESKNPAQKPSKAELELFGINEEFKIFLRGLTYSTFRDFGNDELEDVGFVKGEGGDLRLNAWQEIHAKLILQTVKELEDLRYVLCPRRMPEERFWRIYFSLAYKHLPPNCVTGEIPPKSAIQSKDASPVPSEHNISQDYTFVQPYGQQESSDDTDKVTSIKDNEFEGESSSGKAKGDPDSLENDEDLEAYLENVLKEGGEEDGDLESGLEEFEDFDEYMEQLEAEGGEKDSGKQAEEEEGEQKETAEKAKT